MRATRLRSARGDRERANDQSQPATQPAFLSRGWRMENQPTSRRQCTPGCRHERMAYVVARATATLASWFSFLSHSTVARRSSHVWRVVLRSVYKHHRFSDPPLFITLFLSLPSCLFLFLFFLTHLPPLALLRDLPCFKEQRKKERKKETNYLRNLYFACCLS